MFKFSLSSSAKTTEIAVSKQFRYLIAIGGLVLISVMSSAGGSPVEHTITNSWEGLIWGIADPVIDLARLAGIVGLGLLSARLIHGVWIALGFAVAVLGGEVMNLMQFHLPSGEIAIAISTAILGMMLLAAKPIHGLAIAFVSVAAGLFHGYASAEFIHHLDPIAVVTYFIGVIFTQTVIFLSAREIGRVIISAEINQLLSRKLRLAGLVFAAIGFVCLGNSL
ncbi:HupE/UreJ family protein [Richelia sinica FACHB-800]|nr:HupE/UreJ family protein [Richelia sinica FACHB-800]